MRHPGGGTGIALHSRCSPPCLPPTDTRRVRIFVSVLLLLLCGGFYLVTNYEAIRDRATSMRSRLVTSIASRKHPGGTRAAPLSAADYERHGVPALDGAWDAVALKSLTIALRRVSSGQQPLPGPDSEYGKAFGKLRYTAMRFHHLSGENKNPVYNAFIDILPIYIEAHNKGHRCDLEMALLIGLEFELIAGLAEDQLFVKNSRHMRTRTGMDLDRRILIVSPSWIGFSETSGTISETIRERLKMLADPRAFRPEARVLGFNYISLHLPTIVRRVGLINVREQLAEHRAAETNEQARSYYDVMLNRIP